MSEPKRIGNVNILDLRKTTEEALAQIRSIGNVNVLIYSPETASLLSRLTVGNINVTAEVPAEVPVQMVAGSFHLTPGQEGERDRPAYLVIMGPLYVSGSDESEAIRGLLSGYTGITVMGSVVCPESLSGIVRAKLDHLLGKLTTYPDDARLVVGSLDLTRGFLESIDEPKTLVVTRSLRALDDVAELVRSKIPALRVHRAVVCAECNEAVLRSILTESRPDFTVIPHGSRFLENDLVLDETILDGMEAARLFVTGDVIIGSEVTAAALERGVDELRSFGRIVCPAALKTSLLKAIDPIESQPVFYEGELWVIDGEAILHPSRFDYLEGRATLWVTGELRIEADLEPRLLADRFDKVHNLGRILCSPEQRAAIDSRLGIHDGEIVCASDEASSTDTIGNVNMLAL